MGEILGIFLYNNYEGRCIKGLSEINVKCLKW